MNIKSALAVCLISFGVSDLVAKAPDRKAEDPVAYRTGEKTGELLAQLWVAQAKKNMDKVIALSEQIVSMGKAYSAQINKSFLQGNLDCLKKKDIKAFAEKQKLDKYECAHVLACYYFQDSLISEALVSGAFDLQDPEEKEDAALERAAREIYGKVSPQMLAELRKSLAEDEEYNDCVDLTDLGDDSEDDEDDDEDDED